METTPSSMPRATCLASEIKNQHEAAEKSLSSWSRTHGGRRQERPVLVDITNDSPIVGLATGSLKTPSSSMGKSRARAAGKKGTPGSGEALLRGQVKTLLQKVEEEAELVKVKVVVVSSEEPAAPFRALLGHLRSPSGLLAPTPANTPQIMPITTDPSAQKDEDPKVPLVAAVPNLLQSLPLLQEETPNLHQCLINRALQFDSPEESEVSHSSLSSLSDVTYQLGSGFTSCPKKPIEDDRSSVWSMQTNLSSHKDEEEEEDEGEGDDCRGVWAFGADDDGDYYEGEEEGVEEESSLDALCEGMKMMSMEQEEGGLPKFAGKHTRFTYNNDDEMVGEEEAGGSSAAVVSPGILLLRGLPAPEGKHLRFQEQEEED